MTNTVNLALNSILHSTKPHYGKKENTEVSTLSALSALTSIALTVMLGIVSYFGLFYQQKP